jgi:hypothetical protein
MTNLEHKSVRRIGWFTSSYTTNGGNCVEVKFDGDSVLVRDTKYRRNPANDPATQPIIALPAIKWKGFLEKVVTGSVDDTVGVPAIELDPAGGARLRAADGTVLVYTRGEWTAFINGIRDGEFSRELASV